MLGMFYLIKGPPFNLQGGRGGGVVVADKLFISTRLSGALKIPNINTCLYGTLLDVYHLFHAESAQNYLFQKNSNTPLLEDEWWPLKQ